MSDADRDKMLREMAANRGLRLVKSRRRKPGGDFGRYGLKDPAGKEVFGFGKSGLTATPEEIEAHLREFMVADWKTSLKAAASAPKRAEKKPAPKPVKRKAAPSPPPPPPPPPPPAPKLVIREAKPGDAGAIAALVGELGFETTEAAVAKRLRAVAKGGEPVLVAVLESVKKTVIGCLAWHVTPVIHRPTPVGRVTMLIVTKDARRQGVGEKLVAEAEARTAERGCGLIEVTSNIELGGAHQFYRRIGFERTSYRFVKKLEPR
jgi:ribosomal protein S18 acetylase RimI-like enzyme